MSRRIFLSPPHMTDEALNYLQDAVNSNWIAPVGPHVDAFERELAEIIGTSNVLVTNSGTSAIHLGLLALKVQAGDEVICSTFTFCASVNPVVYCNAIPVFVDSDADTWNMDPGLLEEAIIDRIKKTGKKPKAIVLVHLYGMPARIEEIMDISLRYEIPVLEDAAEALGSVYKGRQVGTFGAVGVLSFNGNKIITTSGGGALFSSHASIVDAARYYRQEAREPLAHYEHKAIGYNYRLSNVLAALGRSQLTVLNDRVRRRRENFEYYQQALAGFSSLYVQKEVEGMRSNRWLTAVDIQEKGSNERVRQALEKNDIESRRVWKPMHMQPVFISFPFYGNGASEALFNRALCLPSGSNLSVADLERVVEVVEATVKC